MTAPYTPPPRQMSLQDILAAMAASHGMLPQAQGPSVGPLQPQNMGGREMYQPIPVDNQGIMGNGGGQGAFDLLPLLGALRGAKQGVDLGNQGHPLLGGMVAGLSLLPEGRPLGKEAAEAGTVGRKLLRGFHGTDAEFSGFRDGPTWFSSNRNDVFVKTRKNVKEAALDIANPLTPKTARERIGDIQGAFMQSGVPEQESSEVLHYIQNNDPSAFFYVSPAMQKAYESLGFDGLHINEGLKNDWYTIFRGNQARVNQSRP